ncbi:MAG: ThiF family adenylyltransferase [Desulfamplus sp.]|nr:ThiF family adenylyltransferase [Desulfamplus sp.]
MVFDSLANMGFLNLTLVDPDIIEEHNLGEMACVSKEDVGGFKVIALKKHFYEYRTLITVIESVNSLGQDLHDL